MVIDIMEASMAKIRRGGYLFITWKGDHDPKHVHVFKDSRAVLKWNLDNRVVMSGKITPRLLRLIDQLSKERKL
jgi:hypothetical protein